MKWRSLSHYWEDMGGDPELEPADDELAQREALGVANEDAKPSTDAGQVEVDLPF